MDITKNIEKDIKNKEKINPNSQMEKMMLK